MTKEQEKISNHNRRIAHQKLNVPKGYVMHHIDPNWKEQDIERYIQWNIEDLVVMSRSEHQKLHMTKYLSDDTKYKFGNSTRGIPKSDKWKTNMSNVMKGNTYSSGVYWFTDGINNVHSKICPEGYHRGRTMKRNNLGQFI